MLNNQLKIISFNIWDLPFFTRNIRVSRIKQISHFLKSSQADIICLQEAWNLDSQRLIKEILGPKYFSWEDRVATSKHKLWGFSRAQGGLMILSLFPILSMRFTPFSVFHWSWTEWFGNKGILDFHLKTPWGKLRVVNTHLYQPGLFVRLKQFKKLITYLSGDRETPAIIAGDFNEDKLLEKNHFVKLLESEHYLHPSLSSDAPLYTYRIENPHTQTWINKILTSFHLDYFFIKGIDKLGLEVNSYAPIHLEPTLSDHDPIILSLRNKK